MSRRTCARWPHGRDDDAFADELYCALCNADWVHDDGSEWHGSWRYAAAVVADLRDCGECYLDFYCSPNGAGERSPCAWPKHLRRSGGTGPATGAPLRLIDVRTGESEVLVDGEWAAATDI